MVLSKYGYIGSRLWYFLSVLVLIIGNSGLAQAEPDVKYISDVLVVNLRSDFNEPYRVVTRLQSGDQLEIINIENGFAQVRTTENISGWVPAKYLKSEKPKKQIITELQHKIEELENNLAQNESAPLPPAQLNSVSEERLTELTEEIHKQRETITLLRKKNESLSTKNSQLSASIAREQKAIARLENKIQEIQKQKDIELQHVDDLSPMRLSADKRFLLYMFIAGGIVFFGGLISGRFFLKSKRRFLH
ncbi:MAG: TIGR04211 family SH3 domain-containing protein [Desulfobulbaceae bacterium]|nr:MAG: TIGR04211 family SH3 domain-containing protein [Desulfobulbaceae bacterium]